MGRPLRRLALAAALLLLPTAGVIALANTAFAGAVTATFGKVSDWTSGYQGKYTIANGTATAPPVVMSGKGVQFTIESGGGAALN